LVYGFSGVAQVDPLKRFEMRFFEELSKSLFSGSFLNDKASCFNVTKNLTIRTIQQFFGRVLTAHLRFSFD